MLQPLRPCCACWSHHCCLHPCCRRYRHRCCLRSCGCHLGTHSCWFSPTTVLVCRCILHSTCMGSGHSSDRCCRGHTAGSCSTTCPHPTICTIQTQTHILADAGRRAVAAAHGRVWIKCGLTTVLVVVVLAEDTPLLYRCTAPPNLRSAAPSIMATGTSASSTAPAAPGRCDTACRSQHVLLVSYDSSLDLVCRAACSGASCTAV